MQRWKLYARRIIAVFLFAITLALALIASALTPYFVAGWSGAIPLLEILSIFTFGLITWLGIRLCAFLLVTVNPKWFAASGAAILTLVDGLAKIDRDLKFEQGKGFHAFRRFRTAHLRKNRVPWDLQKLWLGHANRDVTDRYAEQLKEDVEWRKEVAENAGLGFQLPIVECSVGLLGLPKQKKSKLKKVA